MPMNRRAFFATALLAATPNILWAKSKDPIRLAVGAGVESQVMAALAAKALRKSGFKVDLIEISAEQSANALISGALHAHANLARSAELDAAISDKTVRSLGGRVGNKRNEPVLKIVSIAMKSKWPDAQKMLKRMVLSDEKLSGITALVSGGASPDEAVATWWKANKKTWSPWVAASKNWMKP